LAVQLVPEDTRRSFQDFIRGFRLTILKSQALNLRNTIRGDTHPPWTEVNVSEPDPRRDRLDSIAKQQSDPVRGSSITSQLSPKGCHHPNHGNFLLSRILPTISPVFVDASILDSKV
jgi:hypothetical protein